MCPSSGKITVSMTVWFVGCKPDIYPHRLTNTKCRNDTVISPDDKHIVARNMYRKEINILKKIVQQFDFIYKAEEILFAEM
jgi:hypothetical protein